MIFFAAGLVLSIPLKFKKNKKISILVNAVMVAGSAVLFFWLSHHDYYGKMAISMRAVYRPAVLFIVASCLLSVSRLFSKKVSDEKKMVYIICILLSLLPAFGSNNAFYSVINFMFFIMPVFLWQIYDLILDKDALTISCKYVMGLLLLILICRAVPFGINYIYEDAGSNGVSGTEVIGVPALNHMKTSKDRAQYLSEGFEAVADCDYILTFGNVAGASYYYGKEALCNPWDDLRSVRMSVFTNDLHKLENYVNEKENIAIIIGSRYVPFYTDEAEVSFDDEYTKEKAAMLKDAMDSYGFKLSYENPLFGVFRLK